MKNRGIDGLYAITPDLLDTKKLISVTKQALAGGTKLIQYRNKIADKFMFREQAKELQQLCRDFDVPLIINDHLDIAIELDADGLHVGQTDVSVSMARHQLGHDKIIGASCYNQRELAIKAQKDSADYVAFGAFFASVTKPNTTNATIDLLCEAKAHISVPIVCIGGINLTNAIELVERGCDAIAVSDALFHAHNIRSTAKQFLGLFKQ
ncbi:MAG: thiamine phosphate synthase [Nitrosomonas sp.]|nr:thiamine phosphate synthase [Nitrosomonas sp.]